MRECKIKYVAGQASPFLACFPIFLVLHGRMADWIIRFVYGLRSAAGLVLIISAGQYSRKTCLRYLNRLCSKADCDIMISENVSVSF